MGATTASKCSPAQFYMRMRIYIRVKMNNIVGDLAGPLNPSYEITKGPVDKEHIYRRNGGCGVVAEAKLYVWGGEGAEQRQLAPDSDSEEDDFSEPQVGGIWSVTVLPPPRITDYPFDVYDLHTCTWSRQMTRGDVPLFGLGMGVLYTIYIAYTRLVNKS